MDIFYIRYSENTYSGFGIPTILTISNIF